MLTLQTYEASVKKATVLKAELKAADEANGNGYVERAHDTTRSSLTAVQDHVAAARAAARAEVSGTPCTQ